MSRWRIRCSQTYVYQSLFKTANFLLHGVFSETERQAYKLLIFNRSNLPVDGVEMQFCNKDSNYEPTNMTSMSAVGSS
jgi:hypothetical protein